MARPQHLGVAGGTARVVLALLVSAIAGVLVAGMLVPLVGTAGVLATTASQDFENLPSILSQPVLPAQTIITTSDGVKLATIYSQNRVVVSIDAISPLLQKAVVAVEDSRFYEHNGVDLRGLGRALVSNAQGGAVQGGSTLTQQYVKNVLVLTADTDAERAAAIARTPERKLREIRLALGLEKVWTKKQILQGYLNIAYFGDGAYGAEAASLRYFGKHASALTLAQAATLAGIVQSPVSYDPTRNPKLSTKRRNVVLKRMYDQGIISNAQWGAALATPMAKELHVQSPPNGCTTSVAPFFCNYVIKIIKTDSTFGATPADRQAFLDRGGYTIRTTLDSVAQAKAQKALTDKVPMTDRHGAAISVVQPGTGNIMVMAQNRLWGAKPGAEYTTYNYNVDASFNGASFNGVGFQTGSTFKPFVLAAALQQKIPVNQTIVAPTKVEAVGYEDCSGKDVSDKNQFVGNSEGGAGTYDMRTGTWASVNTFFMLLEKRTGLCQPARIAASMGVHRSNGQPLKQVPTLTLGVNQVAPLRMAEAYATFAASGKHCDSRAILSITDAKHQPIKVPPMRCGQVLDPKIADGVTAILNGVIDGSYSGRTGARESLGRPAAGKTGTTQGNVNVWFCGFIPQLASCAWVGDPTGSANVKLWSMRNVKIGKSRYTPAYGNNLPGPIWKALLTDMAAHLPVAQFPPVDSSVVHGFTTRVPDVTGLDAAAALQKLADLGFTPELAPSSIPSDVPKGLVARTSPKGGSYIGSGSIVTVYVSSGPAPKPPPTPSTSPSPTISSGASPPVVPPPGGGGPRH